MTVRLEWKPQDCWIGVFWRAEGPLRHVWVCILPMLPIHIIIPRKLFFMDAPISGNRKERDQ